MIKDLYRHFLTQLQNIYPLGEATVITDWVFESIANKKKSDIVKNPKLEIEEDIQQKLKDSLNQLLTHKPIQYILQQAWFYNMLFGVNEHTLIPRPETEQLVETIINDLRLTNIDSHNKISFNTKNIPGNIQLLDIGTGSGCIAIALKKHLPLANILAVDVSKGALEMAEKNAEKHFTTIQFIQLNFLDETTWNTLPVVDIIISNPPYIPLAEKEKLADNVIQFEPHTALFVTNENPLLFYEKIALFAKDHLSYGGRVYTEVHEDFAPEVVAVFTKHCSHTRVINDQYGKKRIVVAYY